eukprot:6955378-Pyramimonas_sp.AAC.1
MPLTRHIWKLSWRDQPHAVTRYSSNDGSLPYLGMPSIYRPRIPRAPTRRPAPRTPDPDEL